MRDVPVAVVSDVPVYRAGLQAVLTAAGYTMEDPSDHIEWARSKAAHGQRAALLVMVAAGAAVRDLERFAIFHCVSVLALTHIGTPAVQLAAIAAGATGTIVWSAKTSDLIRALDAAIVGMAILPASVVRQLAPTEGIWVASNEQMDCLRLLSAGTPVRTIAEALHYSEREMFRRLRSLYRLLGSGGRQEALAHAAELGLV
jgi:DNA-binding NarL/FixJ family response regulator